MPQLDATIINSHINVISKTLDQLKANSFSNLYKAQKSLTGHKRFDFKMSDVKLTTNLSRSTLTIPKKYVAFINDDFITSKDRLKYKRSAFYNKELTIFNIANNPKVFSNSFMVFIDGKIYDTVNLICKDEKTWVVFDLYDAKKNPTGIPVAHFKDLRDRNANVTVLFVPNCAFGTYKTNIITLNQWKNNLALPLSGIKDNLQTDAKYISFINSKKLLFESVITDTVSSTNMLRFLNNVARPTTSKIIHLNIFGFRNLYDQLNIVGTEKFFSIPVMEMPVPVENMMIFIDDVNGYKKFAHNISIKMYYPNVYEIVGNTTNANLTIFVFYSNDTLSITSSYKNDLELYQTLYGPTNQYRSGIVANLVKTYMPVVIDYNIKDYETSPEYTDHLQYKLNKLHDWFIENPEYFRDYLVNQIKKYGGYYIDCALLNMPSKIRNNNHLEVNLLTDKEVFTEPRYIFILKNDFGGLFRTLRFFIDGIFYSPDKKYRDSDYVYYYIPVSMITSTSVIEIEFFGTMEYSLMNIFTDLEPSVSVATRNKMFTPSDMYLVDMETNFYIDRDKWNVTPSNNLDLTLTSSSLHFIESKAIVNLLDSTLFNKNIGIFISRHSEFKVLNITTGDDTGKVFEFDAINHNDMDNFRVFKNGRLIPGNLYDVDFDRKNTGSNFVTPVITKELGDSFVADYTPYKFTLLFEQAEISNQGFVDLRSVLKRPFDLRWHDVYLNGRKLNKKHIDVISPSIIFIKNVNTRLNLVILEKAHEDDIFEMTSDNHIITRFWEVSGEFQSILMENRPVLANGETDIITEIVDVIDFEWMRFFLTILKTVEYINPDVNQINDDIMWRFPNVYTEGDTVLLLNPDDLQTATSRMNIMPQLKA